MRIKTYTIRGNIILLIALIALLISWPVMIHNDYYLLVGIMVLFQIILAVSVFPLIRMGLLFVAQGGFLAIGAYTTALLVTRAGFNTWLAMLISGIVAAIASILVIYPSLRAKGLYFLLVTLSLNQVITIGISNWSWAGGPAGILYIPPPNSIPLPWGATIEFSSVADFYYLVLALASLIVFILYRLWKGYLGKLIKAINTAEDLASSLGVPTLRYKMLIVIICCFVCGIMGSFSALFYGLASPGQFGLFTSFYPIVFGIVGGIGYFAGPIVGTVFLVTLPEFFRFTLEYQPLIYATAVILVMLLFRGGLIGLFAKLVELAQTKSKGKFFMNNLKEN